MCFRWYRPPRRAITGPLRAFVCHLDRRGLRALLPEELVPADELRRPAPPPSAVVWTCDRTTLAELEPTAE